MTEMTLELAELRPDVVVDARRLLCPMPILKVEAGLRGLAAGQLLQVLATDPGISRDLPAWCKVSGHRFLGVHGQGRELSGFVQKG
ncbi:MAG: sulfurtransferase TusA family protein [Magnetococcales bacterium]|nr:sulfurtransferase TusA family protein [Magnetococcales bacterium]NGZ26238.1 sulfurtransferase TusA family protein [Magnetococcales bacterium]